MQKTIYIASPSCLASGGPELLHQLCFKLNQFGFKAKMLYYSDSIQYHDSKTPVHPNYQVYENPYTINFDEVNRSNAIVIIPEAAIELIQYFKQSQIIIWWLSVDNYFEYVEMRCNKDIRKDKNKDVFGLKDKDIWHFVQSYYAKDFVIQSLGVKEEKVLYLSDYLRYDYLEMKSNEKRENYCLFNPQKGLNHTLFIMGHDPSLGWLPIANMTPKQVAALMSKSKVYIDFGNHPGKDRIPREAAMRGCCIITNKAGSAAYQEDVPITEKYKFEDIHKSAQDIIELIRDIYQNFEIHQREFQSYREKIAMEERVFEEQMLSIFKNILK